MPALVDHVLSGKGTWELSLARGAQRLRVFVRRLLRRLNSLRACVCWARAQRPDRIGRRPPKAVQKRLPLAHITQRAQHMFILPHSPRNNCKFSVAFVYACGHATNPVQQCHALWQGMPAMHDPPLGGQYGLCEG